MCSKSEEMVETGGKHNEQKRTCEMNHEINE